MLEVFHLLHCLNASRKAMDKEYYIHEWDEAGEIAKRAHDGMSGPHSNPLKSPHDVDDPE